MLYLIIAGLVVIFDQLFKYFIVMNVELGGHMDMIPGIIGLTNIRNTGAAFSILEGMHWLLLPITAVCVVFLIVYIFKTKLGVLGHLSLAFILGGAVGNAIDRVAFGYVVDMFELEFMNYAIFNIADCFIVCGGILFFICYLVHTFRTEHSQKRMPELDRLLAAKEGEAAGQDEPIQAEESAHCENPENSSTVQDEASPSAAAHTEACLSGLPADNTEAEPSADETTTDEEKNREDDDNRL